MLSLILLVFAFVLAFIAAFFTAPVEPHRTRLIAAALAFYFAACIFGNQVISGLFKSSAIPQWVERWMITGL